MHHSNKNNNNSIIPPPGAELKTEETCSAELEKKMKAEELLPANIKKKKWTIDEAIRTSETGSVYYVDPAEHKENKSFLDSIKYHQLLMLTGAPGSGKSTRLYRLMTQLAEDGYRCFIVTLKEVIVDRDVTAFWTSLGNTLQANYDKVKPIESSRDFLDAFLKDIWMEQKIVIFIDDFDKLYNASDEIRSECLETFQEIRDNNHLYAAHSIVVCGTFSIRNLNSTKVSLSPFNVAESLNNPYFSLRQIRHLFDDYAQNEKITIDRRIVKDVHFQSNGHPSLVCVCGRFIAENLVNLVDHKTKNITYSSWINFCLRLDPKVLSCLTFKRMVDSLLNKNAKNAIDLYQLLFAGYNGLVSIEDDEERKQADFLTDKGVLLKPVVDGKDYRISSCLVDNLAKRYVIPQVYPLYM